MTLRDGSAGPKGFSQVNEGAAEVLLETVRGMVGTSGGHLVDAYCGSGFFAKQLLDRFAKVTGIEWSEGAVRAALAGAADSETYLAGAVEVHLAAALAQSLPGETLLILDPPAEGLSPDVVRIILGSRPADLVYVSCDPATLARDLKKLSTAYRLEYVQPVDMFPQTAEIESVAKLASP